MAPINWNRPGVARLLWGYASEPMRPPLPVRRGALIGCLLALPIGLGAAGCTIPEANLSNLRAAHQPDGSLSYRGDIRNSFQYVFSQWTALLPTEIIGITDDGSALAGTASTEGLIPDPATVSLDNLLGIAEADSSNLLDAGYQIEAFGWLGPDDQYVLGRERAVIELGRAAQRLEVNEALAPPAVPAGPEDLSPVLADLARSVLGDVSFASMLEDAEVEVLEVTPAATPGEVTFEEARTALDGLELDRQGALRVLALCDVLLAQNEARLVASDPVSTGLRELAREAQATIVGLALGECLDDDAPIVRAAAVRALAGVPAGPAPGLLELAATDPAWEVAAAGLEWVYDNGLPLERVPEAERPEARDLWIRFLVGQAQSPETRLSFNACRALTTAVPEGPQGLRPEDWTAWFRASYPDQALPEPLVARRAEDDGSAL